MENEKIKKINLVYLLAYIFVPMVICAICYTIFGMFYSEGGNMAVILTMVPTIASFAWWIVGGRLIYKIKEKKFEEELVKSGFERNHIFYGNSSTLAVDMVNGSVALIFFWNPFKSYVLPANRITKTWVDDGRSGVGFMEGSSRVSFLFNIDNVKVRINTFTSNKRWRMDSNYILTGISKADKMVEVIEESCKVVTK